MPLKVNNIKEDFFTNTNEPFTPVIRKNFYAPPWAKFVFIQASTSGGGGGGGFSGPINTIRGGGGGGAPGSQVSGIIPILGKNLYIRCALPCGSTGGAPGLTGNPAGATTSILINSNTFNNVLADWSNAAGSFPAAGTAAVGGAAGTIGAANLIQGSLNLYNFKLAGGIVGTAGGTAAAPGIVQNSQLAMTSVLIPSSGGSGGAGTVAATGANIVSPRPSWSNVYNTWQNVVNYTVFRNILGHYIGIGGQGGFSNIAAAGVGGNGARGYCGGGGGGGGAGVTAGSGGQGGGAFIYLVWF